MIVPDKRILVAHEKDMKVKGDQIKLELVSCILG